MRRLSSLPLQWPWTTLFVIGALTLFFAFFARSIRVDSAIENLLPAHDPDRQYYEEIKLLFGSDEATVVGVFTDNVFSMLSRIRAHVLTAPGSSDRCLKLGSCTQAKGKSPCFQRVRQS